MYKWLDKTKAIQSSLMVINNHGYAVLIWDPKDHKSKEEYNVISVEGAIWQKI